MHNVSSDEEEPLAAGLATGGHRTAPGGAASSGAAGSDPAGSESVEEESAYHFRRSKPMQYHRVSNTHHINTGFTKPNPALNVACSRWSTGWATGRGKRSRTTAPAIRSIGSR